jgi:hypothetical protein
MPFERMPKMTEITICSYCAKNPRSHSFKKVEHKNRIGFLAPSEYEPEIFYSCPAEAELYDNTESVIKHFEIGLTGIEEWEWFFDCQGMSFSHYTQFGLVRELCKLFAQQGGLKRVYILNSNWLITRTIMGARAILPNFPDIRFIR